MAAHSHAHPHRHDAQLETRRMQATLLLVAAYMMAEAAGGIFANSLALLADAGHMLADVSALGIALAAMWMARRPPTPERTYGFHRAEVLAALLNALALVCVAVWIVAEAVARLASPPNVDAPIVLAVATGGLVVNLLALAALGGAHGGSLNVRGAWLHVMSDTAGSFGVILSTLLLWAFDWRWTDPAASILIAALVVYSALRLLRQVVDVLMEAAPAHIDVADVRQSIVGIARVVGVHDLHVWTITSGLYSLTGHVVVEHDAGHAELLRQIRDMLEQRFGIHHVTIQLEHPDFDERKTCD